MSDLALSIVLGIALAAATGFRVFSPTLIVSGAAACACSTCAWLALICERLRIELCVDVVRSRSQGV
jgi:hypothetical protein